jgi:hypothetical protein
MYDPECARLAKYFLVDPDPDEGIPATEANVASLAQDIQDAIESWFSNKVDEAREREEADASDDKRY